MRRRRLDVAVAMARAVLAAVTLIWAVDATVSLFGAVTRGSGAAASLSLIGLVFTGTVWVAGSAALGALARLVPRSATDEPGILCRADDTFVPPPRVGPRPRQNPPGDQVNGPTSLSRCGPSPPASSVAS